MVVFLLFFFSLLYLFPCIPLPFYHPFFYLFIENDFSAAFLY
jgi:hypothetical protein